MKGLAWLLLGGAFVSFRLAAAPSIAGVSVVPTAVPINVPTTLTLTAFIPDSSLISTSVNLLRVDASGRTLAIAGTLHDDGLHGDVRAGDKVFTAQVITTEAATGVIYFRVSAAFRGSLLRLQSAIISVAVQPAGAPTFLVYGNKTDPHLLQARGVDGTIVDYFGLKDDNGLATGLQDITVTAPNGKSVEYAIDETGKLTNIQTSTATRLRIQWLSENTALVFASLKGGPETAQIVDVPAGSFTQTVPSQGAAPSSSTTRYSAASLRPDSSHPDLQPPSQRRADIAASLTAPANSEVRLAQCASRPLLDASARIFVDGFFLPRLSYPGENIGSGRYAVRIPVPDLSASSRIVDKCLAVGDLVDTTCNLVKIAGIVAAATGPLYPVEAAAVAACELIAGGKAPPDGAPNLLQLSCPYISTVVDSVLQTPIDLQPEANTLGTTLLGPVDGPFQASGPFGSFDLAFPNIGCVQSLFISPHSVTLAVGGGANLQALLLDTNNDYVKHGPSDIHWESLTPAVANVDGNGAVAAKSAGFAQIRATDSISGKSDQIAVTVNGINTLEVAPSTAVVAVGKTILLTLTARDINGHVVPIDPAAISWSSSNDSIAKVLSVTTNTAVIQGEGNGQAVLTVEENTSAKSLTIPVKVGIQSLQILPANPSVGLGSTRFLSVQALDGNNAPLSLPPNSFGWSTSNPSVVSIQSVTDTGATIRGVGAGSSIITVQESSSKLTASVSVPVKEYQLSVQWVVAPTAPGGWSGTRTLTIAGGNWVATANLMVGNSSCIVRRSESGQGQVGIPSPDNPTVPFSFSYNLTVSWTNSDCNSTAIFNQGVQTGPEVTILATPAPGGFTLSTNTVYPQEYPYGIAQTTVTATGFLPY